MNNIRHVEMQKLAVALEDATVNHNRVNIRGRGRLDHCGLDLSERRDIEVGRADENKISALAWCQRSSDIAQAKPLINAWLSV